MMAHPNIDARQEYVRFLLSQGVEFSQKQLQEVASKFNCHTSAVRADIKALTKDPNLPSIHVSATMRKQIRKRDGRICQYCSSLSLDREYVVEHVIPAPIGPARPYNLVIACQPCNSKKGTKVWHPYNLDAITAQHPLWRNRVAEMADPTQPACTVEFDSDEMVQAREYYRKLYESEDSIQVQQRIKRLLAQIVQVVAENPSVASEEWHTHLNALLSLVDRTKC